MGATRGTGITLGIPRWSIYLLAAVALAMAGCAAPDPGDDTIAQNAVNSAAERGAQDCEFCHTAANGLDPVVLNGSGAAGQHVAHVSTKGYDCEECHATYRTAATHFNGTLDTGNASVNLIQFDTLNSGASWSGDTGAGTGSCANAYCHGEDSTPSWYAAQTLTCTSCHSSGSPIDPLVTGGSGLAGQHVRHVTNFGLGCVTCHGTYTTSLATHANGTDDADTSSTLVSFVSATAPTNPDGVWSGDTGAATGSCADTYCHGGEDGAGTSSPGPSWYTATIVGCTACHNSGNGGIDPVTIDTGVSLTGKHDTHVTTRGIPCTSCHADYLTRSTHIDKTYASGNENVDTANSANDLVTITGSLASIVTWDAGTNSCSAQAGCHTTTPARDWYQ